MAMRLSAVALGVLGGLAATFSLTGCSTSAPVTPPAANALAVPAKAVAPLVYVSDAKNSVIAIFDLDGTRIGSISKGLKYPSGLFVDRNHNLWVADAGHSDVVEYARGGSAPIATIADGKAYTQDVTICPNGNIYVATLLYGITVYKGKTHRLAGTLNYSGGQFQFVTCDRAGNVFASGVVGTNGNVVAFPGGKEAGAHALPIYSAGNLGGIKLDNAGNLLVVNGGDVLEFTEAGAPTGVQIPTDGNWFGIALSRNGTTLLGADSTVNAGVSLSFPGGVAGTVYSGNFGEVWGVAYDPGQKGI
jgi:hypothetical protein